MKVAFRCSENICISHKTRINTLNIRKLYTSGYEQWSLCIVRNLACSVSLLETAWMDGWMNGECVNVANNCVTNRINAKTKRVHIRPQILWSTGVIDQKKFHRRMRDLETEILVTFTIKINDSESCHIKGRVLNACCSILYLIRSIIVGCLPILYESERKL